MRISSNSRDPGFDPIAFRKVSRVTCDGAEVPMCVTADTEQGVALAFQTGENGEILRDPTSGDYVLARLTGRIEVEMLPAGERDWDKTRTTSRGAKVQVGREPGTLDILVQVYSLTRPGAIKQMRLNKQLLPVSAWSIAQKAGAAGGAAAEMLCEQFGDGFDPSTVASECIKQCSAMLRAEGHRHG